MQNEQIIHAFTGQESALPVKTVVTVNRRYNPEVSSVHSHVMKKGLSAM